MKNHEKSAVASAAKPIAPASVEAVTDWPLTADAARALGVSPSTMVRLANQKKAHTVRDASGQRRYEPESLALLAAEMSDRNPTRRPGHVGIALGDGELTAGVFEQLGAGVEPIDIVIGKRLPPAVVKRLAAEYDAFQQDPRGGLRHLDRRALQLLRTNLPTWKEDVPTDRGLRVAIPFGL